MPKTASRPPQDSNYDEPWKSFILQHFQIFLTLYFPKMARAVDWLVPPVFLPTEVGQILGKAKRRNKFIDIIVQVTLLTREKQIILLHFEVQTKYRRNLDERLYLLNCGLRWQFPGQQVVSLVVRTDLAEKWEPLKFAFAVGGFSAEITFPTCKISEKLKTEWKDNYSLPAMVARAQIEALRTTSDASARYEAKKRLIRMLYDRRYERDEVFEILRYLDWMMHLSEDLEQRLRDEIRTYQSEIFPEMTKYVHSWERFARDEGLEEGRDEGRRDEKIEMVLRLLEKRFSSLPEKARVKISSLPLELLDELFDAGLEFSAKDEIGTWLKKKGK